VSKPVIKIATHIRGVDKMRSILGNIKSELRQHIAKVILFSYALILGTSLPLALSRCTTNCLNCGSCSIYLGIIPIIAAIALRNKFRRLRDRLTRGLSRNAKADLRKG
jgi:hypothetical protein